MMYLKIIIQMQTYQLCVVSENHNCAQAHLLCVVSENHNCVQAHLLCDVSENHNCVQAHLLCVVSKNCSAGNSLISFLSESLVFLPQNE